MALINESIPAFKARRDVEVFDDRLQLRYLETYSGNRLNDAKVIKEISDSFRIDLADSTAQRILVSKTTHRIRFENETESQVTIVIEPKKGN